MWSVIVYECLFILFIGLLNYSEKLCILQPYVGHTLNLTASLHTVTYFFD